MIKIAKTEKTIQLEKSLYKETKKLGVFGCFEVTIGFNGNERVDYMTYNTQGIFRCYEIKVSKSDFYSKAKKSFVGHFNYYVMPHELYEEVKEDIPKHIGVYTDKHGFVSIVKNPKKQELSVNESTLKDSMIRSLSRENEKFIKTGDTDYINRLNRQIENYRKEAKENYNKFMDTQSLVYILADKHKIDLEEIREALRNCINKY